MYFYGQGQVVGEVTPGFVTQDLRGVTVGIAQVDTVQAQQRKAGGVRAGKQAMMTFERLVQPAVQPQRAVAP
ncbi:hypothetical protein D3C80_1635180 [compost metagenome]